MQTMPAAPTFPSEWPPPAPHRFNWAPWIWVTVGSLALGALGLGLAAFGSATDASHKTDGRNYYPLAGWTVQGAADLSVKIQYDDGTSRAKADCSMKNIVESHTWLGWQALGASGQLAAIRIAESGC